MIIFHPLGRGRVAGLRDPAVATGHPDSASGQSSAAVHVVRLRSRAVVAGHRLSGAQLAPAGDTVPGGHRALQQRRREEKARQEDTGRAHVHAVRQRQRKGQSRLCGRRRIANTGENQGGDESTGRRRWQQNRREPSAERRQEETRFLGDLGTAHVATVCIVPRFRFLCLQSLFNCPPPPPIHFFLSLYTHTHSYNV